MVLHSGSMEGHYSQFNLLPDMGLGFYMSTNGQDGGSQDVRELIFMYAVSTYFNSTEKRLNEALLQLAFLS